MILPHLLLGTAAVADALSLSTVCTDSYAKAALPVDALPGIVIDESSLTASASYDVSVIGSYTYPDAVFDYCNVTFAYSHNGIRDDRVLVTYWLPAPDRYRNRFLATGGGGFAINSRTRAVSGGIPYGAAAGLTDGGFGGFDKAWDTVFLLANDTINWQSVYMFGYQAIHEMTVIGKAFTRNFFASNSTLYTYYQGCSEGGREGFSQVQRFAGTYDAAIIGAPAVRFSFQQIQHLHSNIVEQTLGYYPPTCELEKIANETIKACDALDGITDGVVSRTDLCKLHFNINSTIGMTYSCAAVAGNTSSGTLAAPFQNGLVTAQGARVAETILAGPKDTAGRQAYVPYQYASAFDDALTQYDDVTGTWKLYQQPYGAAFVERFLFLQNASSVPSLEAVTYDTLKRWMVDGMQRYSDSIETTWPDLTAWHEAGNKVLHWHGESDGSIPAAASVRYRESVRRIMYPHLSYNASNEVMNKWYKYFSIPGAAHCGPNVYQPNAPFPQTGLQVMIDWVETGVEPKTLNATVLLGEHKGENRQVCAWPLRPLWNGDGTRQECVYDQSSLDTWHYALDAIGVPVF